MEMFYVALNVNIEIVLECVLLFV